LALDLICVVVGGELINAANCGLKVILNIGTGGAGWCGRDVGGALKMWKNPYGRYYVLPFSKIVNSEQVNYCSICIHGDELHTLIFAEKINQLLKQNNVSVNVQRQMIYI